MIDDDLIVKVGDSDQVFNLKERVKNAEALKNSYLRTWAKLTVEAADLRLEIAQLKEALALYVRRP